MSVLGVRSARSKGKKLRELHRGPTRRSIGPVGLKGFTILADQRLKGANDLSAVRTERLPYQEHRPGKGLQNRRVQRPRTVQEGETSRTAKEAEIRAGDRTGSHFQTRHEICRCTGSEIPRRKRERIRRHHGELTASVIERIVACQSNKTMMRRHHLGQRSPPSRPSHRRGRPERAGDGCRRSLYSELARAGLDVLYDDRKDTSPGFKFKDAGSSRHAVPGGSWEKKTLPTAISKSRKGRRETDDRPRAELVETVIRVAQFKGTRMEAMNILVTASGRQTSIKATGFNPFANKAVGEICQAPQGTSTTPSGRETAFHLTKNLSPV